MEKLLGGQALAYEIIILVLFLFAAFFSCTETALVSANRIRLETLARKGNRRARRSLSILDRLEDAIGMVLVGSNIVEIATASFLTYLAVQLFRFNQTEIFLLTSVQTIILLIFCEVLPKVVGRARAVPFLMLFSRPIRILIVVLAPLTRVALLSSRLVKRLMKSEETGRKLLMSREEIDLLFRLGGEEGVIDSENQAIISDILAFKSVTAMEVMTPTIDVVSVELGQNIRDLVEIVATTKFSRIPVYRGRVDNIVGYVFYRDIMKRPGAASIDELMYRARYVPATKSIYELYFEMERDATPIYFVVNEFGAVVGMVTSEDIAEELVGEIQTRDHSKEKLIEKVSASRYVLDGNLDLDYFMKKFGLRIDKKGFSTVAGYIEYLIGRIPRRGERVAQEKFHFIIENATERSIEKVIFVRSRPRDGK